MAMQPPSSSSSSSSRLSHNFSYDVFISFRGTDTRRGFTGNLYKALSDMGIRTFIDDKELQRGDEITPSLLKSIEDSRIAVIVFSKNYATSSFCLDELVHIIHYFKEKSRLVLPVFYDVEPSHVRHQTNRYGAALSEFEERFQNNKKNMERLQKWKTALYQAANLSGYHFKKDAYEYEFIKEIVTEISKKINRGLLEVADHPVVGLESRLLHVMSLLDVGCDDGACMIGICGSGGLGKTTLTRALYNLIADQFEGLCFLHNVRENSIKYGLEHLQKQLLSKTLGEEFNFGHFSEGIPIIKDRLHQKKVLLILDDVDKPKQLKVLVGEPGWLGPGSKVIITTRDRHLLSSHEIAKIYDVDGLNDKESLELFRLMAFKSNKTDSSYDYILNRAVEYACGLPLALEVVGSNLFGKSIEEWESTLDKYERMPPEDIQNMFKVSFDALDKEQKSVFLDIVCCFKGCRLAYVEKILNFHYGYCIKSHIGVLVEKSLIKINTQNFMDYSHARVTIHDLIEDTGKEIVRRESPNDPGRHSRLWFHDDIVHVLKENIGTGKIEMIYLNCPTKDPVIDWNGKAFKNMAKLKTLIIENDQFSKGPKYLPSTLRVLKWNSYPSKSLSSSVLNKTFEKMKILKIDNCEYLTHISDVSCLPNLEKISFKNCNRLTKVHDSIGFLSQLQILNAADCNKLMSFPPLKLKSLRKLKLSGCTSLKKFPEILGKMENIKKIILRKTGIEELPFSFNNLTGLTDLTIEGCGILKLPTSILMMSNLFEVTVSGYTQLLSKPDDKLSSTLSANVNVLRLNASNDEFLTIALMWFSNVETLHLSNSNIKILPESLKKCLSIKCIDLDDCKTLEEIRGIPPNLEELSALWCKSLTSSSKRMLMSQELHEAGSIECCFPSSLNERIPEWFECQRRESISFSFRNYFPSLVLLFSSRVGHLLQSYYSTSYPDYYSYYYSIGVYLIINDNVYNSRIGLKPDHTYLFPFKVQDWYLEEYQKLKSMLDEALLKNEWIHAEVRFCDWGKESVVESGIHVIKHLTNMDDFQFTDCKNKISDEYLKSSRSDMKLLSDEDISATPPRYRVLKTISSLYPYVQVTSVEEDPNACAIM